jgi:hypothetical protein
MRVVLGCGSESRLSYLRSTQRKQRWLWAGVPFLLLGHAPWQKMSRVSARLPATSRVMSRVERLRSSPRGMLVTVTVMSRSEVFARLTHGPYLNVAGRRESAKTSLASRVRGARGAGCGKPLRSSLVRSHQGGPKPCISWEVCRMVRRERAAVSKSIWNRMCMGRMSEVGHLAASY